MNSDSLSSYDYHLPKERIATHPVSPRDAARLLVRDASGALHHHVFADLDSFLHEGDVLVVNNSRVIPARLHGIRPPRQHDSPPVPVEILLHKPLDNITVWSAFARPAKRLRDGDCIDLAGGARATVTGRLDEQVRLRLEMPETQVFDYLHAHGEVPLPPYIERQADSSDRNEYQTVYARPDAQGSVAAPTAGLHFTESLLERLRAKGVAIAEVTLHVGAGTFLPVMVEDIRRHKMHEEWGEVSAAAVETIRTAQQNGRRVVAVGTTATRLLETAAQAQGTLAPWTGNTGIFMTPGFRFRVVDCLVTNFHLPKSTLLMLVSAFLGGVAPMQELYAEAIARDYRFYSYGDACFLTRADALPDAGQAVAPR